MKRRAPAESAADRSDEELMERYIDGDVRAFEELFRRYESVGYRFLLRTVKSPDRAHDLYQELFLRMHRARATYDATRPFRPWFFQIARRLALDDVERACHERNAGHRDVRDEGRGPADIAADREQLRVLLASLSPEERYLVLACKVRGRAYEELARELHKSVAAVKKAVSRALRRMRLAVQEPSMAGPRPKY